MPHLDYNKLIKDIVLKGPMSPAWNNHTWHQHFNRFCERELHIWPDNNSGKQLLSACAHVAASVVRQDLALGKIKSNQTNLSPELILAMGLWEKGMITNTLSLEAAEALGKWWAELGQALGQLKSDCSTELLQESCARAIALSAELTILDYQ